MHPLKNPTSISPSRMYTCCSGSVTRFRADFFIYRADDAQEIVYVNRAVLNIFGCEDEQQFRDLTGYTFRGMVHPDDFDAIQASIDEQIADANNNNLDCVEYRIIRRDGEIRWLDDYGHFAFMPGYGNVYYVFISDVTEKRIAEMENRSWRGKSISARLRMPFCSISPMIHREKPSAADGRHDRL